MSEILELLSCPNPKCKSTAIHCDNEIFMGITVRVSCEQCKMSGPEVFITDESELEVASKRAAELWNSLPRALVWRQEPPKEVGNYYRRVTFDGEHQPYTVMYISKYDIMGKIETDSNVQWAGPIPMPKEPTP